MDVGLFTELNKIDELYGVIRATQSKSSLAFGAQRGCLGEGGAVGPRFHDWRNCRESVLGISYVRVHFSHSSSGGLGDSSC